MNTFPYFSEAHAPRVTGRCIHVLSDILMTGLCTYLTGGTDYVDTHLFAKERGAELDNMLSLPNGAPSDDTFSRVFERTSPEESEHYLRSYGKSILDDLSGKLPIPKKGTLYIIAGQKNKLSKKKRLYKAVLDIKYLRKLLDFQCGYPG